MCVDVQSRVSELNDVVDSAPVEKEEEVISLQPIGRGVHNLEPASQSPGFKTSPVTSSFPTDGLYRYSVPFCSTTFY